MAKWTVTLDNLSSGGFSTQYWRETYPRSGLPNQAGRMFSIDMTKPGYIQPGPGFTTFGAASAVTDTLASVVDTITNSSILAHAASSNDIYRINALSGDVVKMHTVSGHSSVSIYTAEMGLNDFQDNLYYAYNHTSGADVGKYNYSSTWNDTWWTGSLSATALSRYGQKVIEIGRNDVMYISNDNYVASYDGTTAQDKALNLPSDMRIVDIRWFNDRLICFTRYAISDDQVGTRSSSLYIWDGTTNSWETEIPVKGIVSCGYVLNGIVYVFYYDVSGERRLAYLNGNTLSDIEVWEDSGGVMPTRYQVTDYKGFLLWCNEDDVYGYGPVNGTGQPRLFHLTDLGSGTSSDLGFLSNLFSDPGVLASNNETLFYLDFDNKFQTTGVLWKSQLFDITSERDKGGQINGIRFNFEALTSGAVLDWSLVNNQGKTIYSDKISYAKATAATPQHSLTSAYYPLNGKVTENFRVELNYANGSSTAPVRIMNIKVYGEG